MIQVDIKTWDNTRYIEGPLPWHGKRHAHASVIDTLKLHKCACGEYLSDTNWPANWFTHKRRHLDVPVRA